ncbi:MAG: hypothetical protein N0C84_05930 [Candidatus Thiodiazotropha taylori]|uniref:Uncharacterized protein n=1 Tax=Candidatus Thiodiazotropha taylori TaxID=2792791 RepID=A0A9E4KB30_9GAMM|nr:hypothetical protein [Candidatus Thiodiazotropha taylori]MCW4255993.1 hypothetical protein [Candidatus Thiodiazotropha taylori]
MPLFDVAILERPTKKEAEEGKSERLVLGPVSVVATDEQAAAISAVMDSTEKDIKVDRARMEVLVRPFG